MNIFYAPPSQIHNGLIELKGQEAIHASKALRYEKGDDIAVVDGEGAFYEGSVARVVNDSVRIVDAFAADHQQRPDGRLAAGIIKKRDRIEFIVEKAVEMGIRDIVLFRADHSVKKSVRHDRLKSIAVSAMKQSLQAWLPVIHVFDSLEAVVCQYPACRFIAARQSADKSFVGRATADSLMLVGPEGGFSTDELSLLENRQTEFISLAKSRLRTETAALSMLAQFHFLL